MKYPKDEHLKALTFFQLAQNQVLIRVLIEEDNASLIHIFTVDTAIMYRLTYSSRYNHQTEYTHTNPLQWSTLGGQGIGWLLREWTIEESRAYHQGWLTTRQISIIVKSRLEPMEATENISARTLLDFGRVQEQLFHESIRNPKDSTPRVFLKRLERFLSDYVSDIEAAAFCLAGLVTRK